MLTDEQQNQLFTVAVLAHKLLLSYGFSDELCLEAENLDHYVAHELDEDLWIMLESANKSEQSPPFSLPMSAVVKGKTKTG